MEIRTKEYEHDWSYNNKRLHRTYDGNQRIRTKYFYRSHNSRNTAVIFISQTYVRVSERNTMAIEILELTSRLHVELNVDSTHIDNINLSSVPIDTLALESFYGAQLSLESGIYLEEVS
jgi:hypothetical protein